MVVNKTKHGVYADKEKRRAYMTYMKEYMKRRGLGHISDYESFPGVVKFKNNFIDPHKDYPTDDLPAYMSPINGEWC